MEVWTKTTIFVKLLKKILFNILSLFSGMLNNSSLDSKKETFNVFLIV